MTQPRVGLDSLPRVTADEALELCVHHLQLAAIYYMNVSEDEDLVLKKASRIINRDNPRFEHSPEWVGACAFLAASHHAHENLKKPYVVDDPTEPDETVKRYLKP